MSLLEEQKRIARRCLEAISEKDFSIIDTCYDPGYVRHDPDSPQVRSREEYRKYLMGLCAVFPDLHFTVDDVFGEGDQVVCRFSITGTHKLPWRGLPATGKQVNLTGINISKMAGNKVVEDWFNTDIFSLALQLGLIPMPAPASAPK
ncbi:MAG TPA: ester cyclase [Ktedonobacteraceae bacterium]